MLPLLFLAARDPPPYSGNRRRRDPAKQSVHPR
jgi:hypothetical protein